MDTAKKQHQWVNERGEPAQLGEKHFYKHPDTGEVKPLTAMLPQPPYDFPIRVKNGVVTKLEGVCPINADGTGWHHRE